VKRLNIFWKAGILFCAACCIILLPGYLRINKLKKQILQVVKNTERLCTENKNLRSEIEKLEKDPFTIKKIAREKLGLVEKGELVIKFVSPETKTANPY